MDEVGVRELLRSGVTLARKRIDAQRSQVAGTIAVDDTIAAVLDRLTQLAVVLADHDKRDLWNESIGALLEIFRLGVPANEELGSVRTFEAEYLMAAIQRVFALGGFLIRRGKYEYARTLISQTPNHNYPKYYWIRYAVTMISRGEIAQFKKSLIAPSSEFVRSKPELFALFDENLDATVNAMCQFDFMQCVVASHETSSVFQAYPNFGAFWNYRTTPIVRSMLPGGAARSALTDISDAELANILRAVDQSTAHNFFNFSGWSSNNWGDKSIEGFLAAHPPTASNPFSADM